MGEPTTDRQRLAAALRQLRQQAKISTHQLGEALGWSQGKVSKMERAVTPADPDDVAAWARAAGADPDFAAELVSLAGTVADQMRSWRAIHGRGLAATQQEIARMHEEAVRFCEFAPYAVPGLLQTPAYAEKVLELADVSGRGGVRAAAAERMRRQAILLDLSRSFRFVITEAALRRPFGPPEVMAAQAAKIVATARLPNVSLAVLPTSTPPVALEPSGFLIYDLPAATTIVVLIELLTRELQLSTAWDVQVYSDAFGRLEAAALTDDAAVGMVADLHGQEQTGAE